MPNEEKLSNIRSSKFDGAGEFAFDVTFDGPVGICFGIRLSEGATPRQVALQIQSLAERIAWFGISGEVPEDG